MNTFKSSRFAEEREQQMDLRLVEYAVYLAAAVSLTLWVGRALNRYVLLVGLGGVALLLQVDGTLASVADLVRLVATKLGLVLLMLGALHLVDLLVQRRLARPAETARPAVQYEPFRPKSGRFPY